MLRATLIRLAVTALVIGLGAFAAPVGAHKPGGGHTTTLSVTCSPATFNQGASTTCTATATDIQSGQPASPQGPVTFSTTQAGITNPFATCNLAAGPNLTSTCSVTHTPTASGAFTITANHAFFAGANHSWSAAAATMLITVNPPAPTHLTVETQPSNTVAGQAINGATGVQVAIRNSLGNIVTTSTAAVTIAIQNNAGGGILSGTKTVNAVAGIAIFNTLSIDKAGVGYTLRATSAGLTGVTTNGFDITPAAPAKLGFAQQPANTTAGQTIGGGSGVTARIEDQFGNVVPSASADITLAIQNDAGGGTLSGTVTRATVNGVATFDDLSIDRVGTGYTLGATSVPVHTAVESAGFDITVGAAARLAFGVEPSNTVAGQTIGGGGGVTVRVEDNFGNLVTTSAASVTVALANNPGGATLAGTTTVNAAGGVATFSDLAVVTAASGYTLAATAGGLVGATSAAFDITAGAADRLAYGQPPTNNEAGEPITPAITVRIEDQHGNLVASDTRAVTVALQANPGSTTLLGTLTRNAVAGIATFDDLQIDVAANGYTLLATASGVSAVESAPFTIQPGVPTQLEFGQQPTDALAGELLTPAVTVRILDDLGNLVTGATNAVTVALQANPGGGTLSGTKTVNAVGGVATFGTLSINAAGSGYTLAATATSLSGAVSDPFDIQVNTASRLKFAQQPTNTVAGQPIAQAGGGITVRVEDASGNLVTASSATVTLAIEFDAGLGTLSGTATVIAVNGIATFADLSIDKVGTGYTLRATSGTLTADFSAAFNISHAAASQLRFGVHPSNTTAGNTITPAVTVRVLDAFDNLVTASTAGVSLAIGANPPGNGVLSGTKTVNAVSGIATFSALSINQAGTGYTLTAASAGLAGTTSNAFDINPGTASKLAFGVQPSDTPLNDTITPAVQVTVQDSLGNTITSSSATVSVALDNNPTGGDLLGTVQATAVNGVATFGTLSVNRTGSGYTLQAISSGLASAVSAAFDITVGAPSQLAFSQEVFNTPPNTVMTPWPVVQVQDADGNLVDFSGDVTVSLGNPQGAVLSGTLTVTAVNGVAEFSNLLIDQTGTDFTLQAAAAGLASAVSNTFDVIQPGFTFTGIEPASGPTTGGTKVILSGSGFGGAKRGDYQVIFGTENPAPPVSSYHSNADGCPEASASRFCADTPAHPPGLVNVIVTHVATGETRALQGVYTFVASTPTKLRFGQQPTDITAGDPFAPVVTVQVQDINGNLVNNATNEVTIAFVDNVAGGNLLGTTTVTAVGGIASFTDLSVDKVGTGYTLVASTSGLESTLTSNAFAVTAGDAFRLRFGQQPTNNDPGVPIMPEITVRVEDQFGNLVTGSNATVDMAIGINAGAGTLSGGTSVAASSGIATFDTLAIDKSGDGYTLVASSTGLTEPGIESNTFDIRVGAPAAVEITQQPGNAGAGDTLSPSLIVRVVDSQGNTVEDYANDIVVSIGDNPVGGTLNGTLTLTPVNGEATFTDLWIDKAGTAYTLVASAFGVASDETGPFDIGPGAATGLRFEQSPGDSSQNSVLVPSAQVQLIDAFGNAVPDNGIAITVAIGVNPGGGALTGTLTQNTVNGIATFNDLVIDTGGDGYTLVANGTGLAQAESVPFNVISVGGGFNIFSPATPAGDIIGYLPTIVASEPFCVDVVAINAAGDGMNTSYNGTLTLQMVDSSVNTGSLLPGNCRSSWTVIQEITGIAFPNSANGRIQVCGIVEPNVWPNVRFRAFSTAGQSSSGCSTDNFAMRPAAFKFDSVLVTDTDWQTAGTDRSLIVAAPSATGGNVHAAGRAFRIQATAVNSAGDPTSNYDGKPKVETLARQIPASCAGCPLGAVTTSGWGKSSTVVGAVRTNNAVYDDVGVINIQVFDNTFSAVDQVDVDLGLQAPDAGLILSDPLDIGRFVPDNFVVAPAITPVFRTQGDDWTNGAGTCDPRSFTYVGQPFGYETVPQAAVSARSASGAVTQSYRNELWKLTADKVLQEYSANTTPAGSADIDASMAPLTPGNATLVSNDNGTGTLTVSTADRLLFEREPLPAAGTPLTVEDPPEPFAAFITLDLRVFDDTEAGVAGNAQINTGTPGIFSNIGFDGGGAAPNEFRYGRLRLINAIGSELEPLDIPYRLETWQDIGNDTFAWVTEGDDDCTTFAAGDFTVGDIQETGLAGLDPQITAVDSPAALGIGALTIGAQAAQVTGSFTVTGTGIPGWLEYNWNSDMAGAEVGPTAKAAFGVNEGNPRRIFRSQSFTPRGSN